MKSFIFIPYFFINIIYFMAELSENQRKKIIKVEQLETFAEIVDSLYGSPMGASGSNHAPGQVPDPGATAGTSKFLCEDGTWKLPSINEATQSTSGLMSSTDKKKSDNVMNLNNNNTTTGSLTLLSNTLYSLGTLTGALTVTLGSVVSGIPNTYMMEFDIDDSAATPTKVPNFPATIVWKEEPVWTTGKHYEVSIRYSANSQAYYGIIAEFDTAS